MSSMTMETELDISLLGGSKGKQFKTVRIQTEINLHRRLEWLSHS